MISVTIPRQALVDFLEDDSEQLVGAYANELQRLLSELDQAEVEISSTAIDVDIDVDGEPDEGWVKEIMIQMANDWSWLPQ